MEKDNELIQEFESENLDTLGTMEMKNKCFGEMKTERDHV